MLSEEYQEYIKSNPFSVKGYQDFIRFLRTNSEIQKAIQIAKEGLEKCPFSSILYIELGRCLLKVGDINGLKGVYEEATKKCTKIVAIYIYFAQFMIMANDLDYAHKIYVDAYKNCVTSNALEAKYKKFKQLIIDDKVFNKIYQVPDKDNLKHENINTLFESTIKEEAIEAQTNDQIIKSRLENYINKHTNLIKQNIIQTSFLINFCNDNLNNNYEEALKYFNNACILNDQTGKHIQVIYELIGDNYF